MTIFEILALASTTTKFYRKLKRFVRKILKWFKVLVVALIATLVAKGVVYLYMTSHQMGAHNQKETVVLLYGPYLIGLLVVFSHNLFSKRR